MLGLLTILATTPAGAVMTLPPGFVDEVQSATFRFPTNLKFLPDGRLLVAEKGGRLWLLDGNNPAVKLWDDSTKVLDSYDRGLIGLEVDPTFPAGRWVYLYYSVDPDSNNVESNLGHWGRLERYQMAANDQSLVRSSRQVLFGTNWTDGSLCVSGSHSVGGLAWGRDGSLLVSVGDGAHYSYMDAGGNDPAYFGPGLTDPSEDVGSFRSRMLQSLDGKILRIDPATGNGLPSNPFWDGVAKSKQSRVYATGVRNSFRLAVKPGTGSTNQANGDPGVIYYGDVGWDVWEEVGVINAPAQNMGWPCYESIHDQLAYQAATPAHDGCVSGEPLVMPIVSLHHTNGSLSSVPGIFCTCIVGGVHYLGPSYPAGYYGGFFVGAYAENWIKVVKTDAQDHFVQMLEFATGADGPVAFARHPLTGDIWFVSIISGKVHRIRYNSTVDVPAPAAARRLSLAAPYPNPSHGASRFALEIPREGELSFQVIDATGRVVWSAPSRRVAAGPSAISWPGTGRDGAPAPSGLYFARARAAGETATRKFVVAH